MVQTWSVKSALIVFFCQVCNVWGESDGGGGNNQRVKLDQHLVITGHTGDGSDVSHGHGSESDYTRYNQSLSSKTLSRLKRSSSNRDAKCEFYLIEYVTSLRMQGKSLFHCQTGH